MLDRMKLFRRSNGYWYVRFERGKERSLRTKDRRLAERLFREIQKEALKGRLVVLEKQERISLSQFIKEYLEWSASRKSLPSYKRDKWSLEKFLEVIGDKPLRAVTSRDVDRYFSIQLSQGRKPTGVNVDYRHLKAAFNKAVEWGYLKKSPFARVKPLKAPYKPPRFLSEKEVKQVLDYLSRVDPEFYDVVFFAIETGCRRKEIANLQVENVDFATGYIRILGKGGKERLIPMTSRLQEMLKRRCKERVGKVFPNWHPDTITHKWQKTMKALGMKYRFHDLRHTTASWLAIKGTPLQFIQELLGHSSIQVTQIYAHLRPGVIKDQMEKVFANLTSAGNSQAIPFETPEK